MLRSQSVVMDRFYVCPLSAPTRASLLTGRYHLRTGTSHVSGGLENMRPEETTLAELFREAGYATACFGKWHNGAYYPYTPNGQGFDEFVGFCCGHWPNYFDPLLQRNERMFRGKGYITDIIADEVIDFMERHKDESFFCYVPFNAPHSPFMVPDQYYDKYRDIEAANDRDRKVLASIYAMVECVDYNIGRLLDKLEDLDLDRNTIVIFMTDNGPVHVERYNGQMRGGKGSVCEGGVRVPFFLRWTGRVEPRIVERMAAHIDVLPTLMDLCGITDYETAFPVDGVSFASSVMGTDQDELQTERMIFTHRRTETLSPFDGGLRTSRFRLEVRASGTELYDMEKDPSETNNLYDSLNAYHCELVDSYQNWFEDVSCGVAAKTMIPVGYAKAPQVRIPTPEGRMYGALKCHGYYNQNWVSHFQTPADSLCWSIDAVADGLFDLTIEYACLQDNPDFRVGIRCDDLFMSAHLPQFISARISPEPRFDTGEAPEMSWGTLKVGRVRLEQGEHNLTIWTEGIPDDSTVRIKTLIIDRIDDMR